MNDLLEEAGVDKSEVALIGSHGQTVSGHPHWEFGDLSIMAQQTGITVAGDFRPADVGAGGNGTPCTCTYDTTTTHCVPTACPLRAHCRSTRSGARRCCAPPPARGGRLCSPRGALPVAGGSTSERRRSGGQRGACMRRSSRSIGHTVRSAVVRCKRSPPSLVLDVDPPSQRSACPPSGFNLFD